MDAGELFRFIGYGLSGAAGAYALFVWLGKRWLEQHFSKRLEEHKHLLNQNLEHCKYQIQALFNRIAKIHEKEFEVLPEAWRKLNGTIGLVNHIVNPVQEYPDFKKMGQADIQELVAKSELKEHQKQELLQADDKNEYYQKAIFWRKIDRAMQSVQEFHNYLILNKIFLTGELFSKFMDADRHLYTVLTDAQFCREDEDRKLMIRA